MKKKNFWEPNFIGIIISQITNKPDWDNCIDIRFTYEDYSDNQPRASGRGADAKMLQRYMAELFKFRTCTRIMNSVSCDDIEKMAKAFSELNYKVEYDLSSPNGRGNRDYTNLTMPCDISNFISKLKELSDTYEKI